MPFGKWLEEISIFEITLIEILWWQKTVAFKKPFQSILTRNF